MSKKEIIKTKNAPSAIGPYSQGIAFNGLVFASGQTPIIPETGLIPKGSEEQAKQALMNVSAVLKAGGSGLDKAVKLTVFLKNMSVFAVVNEVYKSFFSGDYPARSTVEVAALPMDVLVEIEAIGYI